MLLEGLVTLEFDPDLVEDEFLIVLDVPLERTLDPLEFLEERLLLVFLVALANLLVE